MDIIQVVSEYASKHFNINERSLYSRVRDGKTSTVKFVVWEVLHHEFNVPISKLAKAFYRNERTVKLGVSKMKNWRAFDKYYREVYDQFLESFLFDKKEGRP